MSQRVWILVSVLALLLSAGFWACDKGGEDEGTGVVEGETPAPPTEAPEQPTPPEQPAVEAPTVVDQPTAPEPSAQVPSEPVAPAVPAPGETGACAPLAACCGALAGSSFAEISALLSSCSAIVESGVDMACESMKQQIDATLSVADPAFGTPPAACSY